MPPPTTPPTPTDAWTPEPELRDPPPRRFEPSEFPDLNRPNSSLYMTLGGGGLAVGLILFIVGMATKHAVFSILGFLLALAGTALLIYIPMKVRSHMARAEHLITVGVPVIARIVSADNMTGDSTYGRSVRYQVILPGGEMAHRDVNVDDRALPKRIPGDATALVDMNTSDVELYCALPLRAVAKPALVYQTATQQAGTIEAAPVFTPTPAAAPTVPSAPVATPTATPGTMGTLGGANVPQRPARPEPEPAPPVAEPTPSGNGQQNGQQQEQKQKQSGSSGLPWE